MECVDFNFNILNQGWVYYSHLFKGSGVCNKVGPDIQMEDIHWIFGTSTCRQYADLMIFGREGRKNWEAGRK